MQWALAAYNDPLHAEKVSHYGLQPENCALPLPSLEDLLEQVKEFPAEASASIRTSFDIYNFRVLLV